MFETQILARGARSFSIPLMVKRPGINHFKKCIYLDQLKVRSLPSLKRVIPDGSLDDAFDEFDLSGSPDLFRIDIDDRGV
jgi:hypothetical protein